MAFNITLQTNTSEDNKLDKTLTNIMTVSGELKEDTSIIDPVIRIECNLASVTGCNYMTVPTFGRSYFVNNIRSVRTGLVEFSCHVDVLSSFKSQIRSNRAIVKKQENNWNLYLNDGTFKVYQNPMVLTKAFPSGFTTQEFVLAVARRQLKKGEELKWNWKRLLVLCPLLVFPSFVVFSCGVILTPP